MRIHLFFLLIDVWCYPFRQWIIFLKKKHGRSVDDYKYEHNCRGSTNHSYLFICESTLFQQAQLLTKAKFSRRAGWLSMGHWRYWRTLTNHEHVHGSIHGWLRIHGTKTQIIIWINGSYSLILFGRHGCFWIGVLTEESKPATGTLTLTLVAAKWKVSRAGERRAFDY